jgi:hypothetical protein
VQRYPRERIEARLQAFEIFYAHRVFGASRMPLKVYSAPSRFCDGTSGFGVLRAVLSCETCILETVVRDRFVHRQRRELPLAAVFARGYSRISTQADRAFVSSIFVIPVAWISGRRRTPCAPGISRRDRRSGGRFTTSMATSMDSSMRPD